MADVKVSDHALVDCNCKVKVHTDGSGVEVYYCQIHRTAEELLLVLERVRDELKSQGLWSHLGGDTRTDADNAIEEARTLDG